MNRRQFLGAALVLTGCGATTPPAAEDATEGAPSALFVPEDFNPPREIEGDGFVLVPLDTNVTELDFRAYMSSIQHLQDTFSHSTSWPREGLTMEDAVKDMENEQAQFEERKSFPYAVLDANRTRERGCVYVRPSKKEGYDAVVRLWVTAEDFEQGFDSELFAWTQTWVEQAWPFEHVAYPERVIPLEEWEALPDKA